MLEDDYLPDHTRRLKLSVGIQHLLRNALIFHKVIYWHPEDFDKMNTIDYANKVNQILKIAYSSFISRIARNLQQKRNHLRQNGASCPVGCSWSDETFCFSRKLLNKAGKPGNPLERQEMKNVMGVLSTFPISHCIAHLFVVSL